MPSLPPRPASTLSTPLPRLPTSATAVIEEKSSYQPPPDIIDFFASIEEENRLAIPQRTKSTTDLSLTVFSNSANSSVSSFNKSATTRKYLTSSFEDQLEQREERQLTLWNHRPRSEYNLPMTTAFSNNPFHHPQLQQNPFSTNPFGAPSPSNVIIQLPLPPPPPPPQIPHQHQQIYQDQQKSSLVAFNQAFGPC